MSAKLIRQFCCLFAGCLLLGCGGGNSDSAATTDTTTDSSAAAPGAPPAPAAGHGALDPYASASAPATTSSTTASSPAKKSSGEKIDTSTPDGTVREAMQAIQDNEFERVWDLLPSSMQTSINDVFKEFGNQVDAELWDKSFNLLNRYMGVMIAKEDMVYQTPETQQQFQQAMGILGQAGMSNPEWLTPEKLKTLSKPMNSFITTLLNSELSSTKKLKSFDGRVFFAKSVNPMVSHLKEFVQAVIQEMSQSEELKSNMQVQMMLSQADLGKAFEKVQVRTESQEDDFAVVVIEYDGVPQKMNFVRVDGKWVPEQMGLALPNQLAMAKVFIPMVAGQINAQKARVMPALEQIEPLVDALQKAKTQEEFNTAYANINTQAPQLLASAMGMPGLSAQFGGGLVKVSPVKVNLHVTGPMTDEQLGEVIAKLEALTDDPQRAITLPVKSGVGDEISLEITPVNDPQAFSNAISFAEGAQYNAEQKAVIVSLKFEPPPQPAETSEDEKSGRKP